LILCLFNCALLMHIGSGHWLYQKTTAFIVVMVGLQFLNFRIWWATLLSAMAFIIVVVPSFPRLANHANIETLLGIALLILSLYYSFKKEIKVNPQLISNTFRFGLISLYFMAGFHKLNYGFF